MRLVKTFLLMTLCILPFVSSLQAYADPPDQLDYQETYSRAKILQVINQNLQTFNGAKTYTENLKVQLLEGREKGKIVIIGYSTNATFTTQIVTQGETIVVDSKPDPTGKMYYAIYDTYRLTTFWWTLGLFILLILFVVGKRGIGAIIGLGISLMTILLYIIPQILKGKDPLMVCIIGAIGILFVTTYIAHGVSLKTTVALISTALSLILAGFLSIFAVHFMFLLGLGDQNSYALQLATTHQINPQGILLGGIIIGTLGALNDITTTQSITIFTLAKENPKQNMSHLFWKSMYIGREHIISMINTLVLAYAGSSFIIFLFFAFNPANLPWWLLLNDQLTMEEMIRAIVGSTVLVLAVPLTTFLATWASLNKKTLLHKLYFS